MLDELLEQGDAPWRLQLEGDRELVPLAVLGGWHAHAVALTLDAERQPLAPSLARLDLDHAGPEVGQQHRAEGHGDDLAQVEDGDVAQRVIHGVSGHRGR